jgi:hypothetical protein
MLNLLLRRNRALRRPFAAERDVIARENGVTRSFIMYTHRQILLK